MNPSPSPVRSRAHGATVPIHLDSALVNKIEGLFHLPVEETIQVLYNHYCNQTALAVRPSSPSPPRRPLSPISQRNSVVVGSKIVETGDPPRFHVVSPRQPRKQETVDETRITPSRSRKRQRREAVALTYFTVAASHASSSSTRKLASIESRGRYLHFGFALPVVIDRIVVATPGKDVGPSTFTAYVCLDGISERVFAGDGPLRDLEGEQSLILAAPVRHRAVNFLLLEFNRGSGDEDAVFSVDDVVLHGHYHED